MISYYRIKARVQCPKAKANFTPTILVTVAEDDGLPVFPPIAEGCYRSSSANPCPNCISFVKAAVFHALPLPNGSTFDVFPEFSEVST